MRACLAPPSVYYPALKALDSETGHHPKKDLPEVPLPPDDESAVDEAMSDVDANNSVSSEHSGSPP